LFAFHDHGANGDAGIEVAGEIGVEDAAAVDSAAGGFEFFDDLHGADFGSALRVPAGKQAAKASMALSSGRRRPSSAETRCMTCE